MPSQPTKNDFANAASQFEEGVARICGLYGVNPLCGRLFAALFLAPAPLSLDDLCRHVGAAKSTVSVALRQLLSMRVVRRLPPGRDRRDFYQAVADPWEILADWARIYLTPEIEMWRETGAALDQALRSAKDAPRGRANAELRSRLTEMRSFVDLFEGVIDQLARAGTAPPAARTIRIHLDGEKER
jgi:DNA-binding transcriptional regulator GbsR (MarR family)